MDNELSPEKMVGDFIDKFGASRDPDLWKKLIEEESKEVVEAFGNLMKELADLVYVCAGHDIVSGGVELEYETPAMQAATKVFEYIDAIPMEIRQEAFKRVHQSNMSKLDDDGKPIKREDGKILKGPNYKPADMSDLL